MNAIIPSWAHGATVACRIRIAEVEGSIPSGSTAGCSEDKLVLRSGATKGGYSKTQFFSLSFYGSLLLG
jgi:hypothetical protein